MGLDMYLSKKHYVKNWDHMNPEDLHSFLVKQGNKVRTDIKTDRISSIEEEVMYWRKANAIHRWFVENVQEGVDNCGTYYVDESQLQELVGLCREVLEDHAKAEVLLPVQQGFFFGSDDYDDWYFENLKETADVISKELEEETLGSFYYQSSW